MTNITKAAQQALDALFVAYDQTCSVGRPKDWKQIKDAIDALSKALQDKAGEVGERAAPYGYCPECGAPGVMRERRPDGDDKCSNGHQYPSRTAHASLTTQPAAQATHDEDETTLRDVDPKADAFLADQQATPEPVRWPEAPKSAGMATSQEAGKWRITLEFDHDTDAHATHTALMDAGWLHRTIRTQPATPPQQAAGEPVVLPSFDACSAKKEAGLKLNPLERFVLENDPADPEESAGFSLSLLQAIDFVVAAHPAPGVPEIDYTALIHAAWGKHKYAQGTGGCIAFKHGAEWFRYIALAAAQSKGADHG